jgi:flagellin
VSFDINTNVASLQAQNYLTVNSNYQSKTINEVTSGLRIVNSGDDAAGLAIANSDRSDEAVLTQGIQNANNGLSQLQIIDGGMNNISQLLDRARTLATESATGTLTQGRDALNTEFQSVLGEISRQAQAIGMNTGGTFAKNMTVLVGGGQGNSGAAAVANGSISLNLANATVDAKSLGLMGVQSIGVAGSDIGTGSASSVANILANQANTTATSGYTTFTITGPGFSGANGVKLNVNLSGVTDTDTLVDAVNTAIQQAGTGNTQAATAFQNANVTAAVNTDATGRQQLTFTSSSAAFQVQAGDQMANALMGNLGAKAVMTGTTNTSTFTALNATDTLQFSFNGGPVMSFGGFNTETTAASVAATLDGNLAFAANASASYNSNNQLVITSLNDNTGSSITVGSTNAATIIGLSGTATVNASTGKSLGEVVTANLGATGVATLTGTIVQIQGGGLASPVDITLGTDTTQAAGVQDLLNQVNTNTTLQAAGITASAANGGGGTLAGGTLTFTSNSGQNFNVSAVGDSVNSLGLGNYLPNGTAFNTTSITAANAYVSGVGTDNLEISVAGGTAQQISVTGYAADTAQNLADQLNSAIAGNTTLAAAGLSATVNGNGNLVLSTANGTAFRVAEGVGDTADQILGFANTAITNTLTQGAYTGGGGTAVAGDAGSFAATPTSTTNNIYFDAGGSTSTSVLRFKPIANAQDAQTISISANDASGTAHSLAVVLSNNTSARNAGSLDQAIATINAALQSSDDSTLQQIVAVKSAITNSSGVVDNNEGIQFLSTLGSFSVGLSAAGTNGTVGIGNTAQQGTVQVASALAGGGTANVSNQAAAEAAVTAVGNATTSLGAAQAVVGLSENEFNYAINLAQSQLTNTTAAEASIRDADMAAEAANLTKAQILVQAGVAALAQANSAPQQVLTLLRS